MTDITLKPCPFCGGTAMVVAAMGEYWGYCGNCTASSRATISEDGAAELWNMRAGAGVYAMSDFIFGATKPGAKYKRVVFNYWESHDEIMILKEKREFLCEIGWPCTDEYVAKVRHNLVINICVINSFCALELEFTP